MRVVCISDTHGQHPILPEGDILLHAGDATMGGTPEEVAKFDRWLGTLRYHCILFTPGNHDFAFTTRYLFHNAKVLINDSFNYCGVKIWASPYTQIFGNWAFMKDEWALKDLWATIPSDTDIVVTHSPPKWVLDRTCYGTHEGSLSLANRIKEIVPKLHVFGHIHEGYGMLQEGKTQYVNASLLDENYENVNQPYVIDI